MCDLEYCLGAMISGPIPWDAEKNSSVKCPIEAILCFTAHFVEFRH